MVSAWISHIKEFAKKHGLTYKQAISDPECKSSYHSTKTPAEKTPAKRTPKVKISKTPKVKVPKVKPATAAAPLTEDLDRLQAARQKELTRRLEIPANPTNLAIQQPMPIAKPIVPVPGQQAMGLLYAPIKCEADNGLTHIYPLNHRMLTKLVRI
jgi:hypothetical protein